MDKRQEELEKKRQKLSELRKAREERRLQESMRAVASSATSTAVDESDVANTTTTTPSAITSIPATPRRQDIDALLSSILDRSTPTTNLGGNIPDDQTTQRTTTLSVKSRELDTSVQSTGPIPRPTPTLVSIDIDIFDMPPRERVLYSKEIQTDPTYVSTLTGSGNTRNFEDDSTESKAGVHGHEEAAHNTNDHTIIDEDMMAQDIAPVAIRELSEEERKAVLTSDQFRTFFDRSSKFVERALNVADRYDFLKDYTVSHDVERDDGMHKHIKMMTSHMNEKWTKGRTVTSVAWNPQFSELYLASYSKSNLIGSGGSDVDGLIAVWNTHMPDRPEFLFQSQSSILVARFSTFHPNLIIGGTYSGQILIWDTRTTGTSLAINTLSSSTSVRANAIAGIGISSPPVLRTPMSSGGHTHPVFAMTMVGTTNAHNLITASTDGLVCAWQLDMLAQPQETLELVHPNHAKTDEIAVTTIDFPEGETGIFCVGTEEGNIYQVNRYDRARSKAGIKASEVYCLHTGVVTGLSFHPLAGPIDFSDLFLSCSVDWTICLWRTRVGSMSASAVATASQGTTANRATSIPLSASAIGATTSSTIDISPLFVFQEVDDYVYDVQWSPVHPAVFASVDGSGNLDLWNLNRDKEVPSVRINVTGNKALNKLQFDEDGKHIVTGSSDGTTYVYELGEMFQPRDDEWQHFQQTLATMEVQAAEQKLYMREQ